MDILANEIEKGLAREHLKKQEFELAIEHYDKYTNFVKDQIETNTKADKKELNEKLSNCINEINIELFNMARDSFNNGEWIKTTKLCKKLIENNFNEPSIYKFISFCYRNLKQHDIRLDFIKKYTELAPDDPENNKLLAEAYFDYDKKKYSTYAIELLEKHLQKHSKDDYVWNFMGHIYGFVNNKKINGFNKQIECFKNAKEIAPNNPIPLKNLAHAYARARKTEEAEAAYEELFAKHKNILDRNEQFGYAAFKLRSGDYLTGFKVYECRFNPDKNGPDDDGVYYPKIDKPQWDGKQNLQNSTLLVHFEQGLGDNIMFIRFVKNIRHLAKKVIAVVPDLVYPLFWESELPFEVYPAKHPLNELKFDYHVPLISLPHILKITPETITDKDGYLKVNPQRIIDYRKTFMKNNQKFKIGINFEGGEHGRDQMRDIDWERIKDFAELKNVEVYCLNKNKDEAFFKHILPNTEVIALGPTFQSFADSAAAILNMDYVVSTDSGILNLAGALGVESLGLFNFDYEYRWYNAESGKIPWYSKVKSIVNDNQDDWEPTIEKAIEEVKKVMAKKGKK